MHCAHHSLASVRPFLWHWLSNRAGYLLHFLPLLSCSILWSLLVLTSFQFCVVWNFIWTEPACWCTLDSHMYTTQYIMVPETTRHLWILLGKMVWWIACGLKYSPYKHVHLWLEVVCHLVSYVEIPEIHDAVFMSLQCNWCQWLQNKTSTEHKAILMTLIF